MSSDGDSATNANLQMQLQLQNQRAQMQQQQLALHAFWQHQIQDISQIDPNAFDFKTHQLPLARIKKIMKTDEDVRMISAEAPVLFAKACEMFILELSLRAWIHTEENKRRTLQRNDIAMAITKTDVFDFLIDIVPRDDIKPAKKGPVDPQAVYQQQLQQQQAAMLQQLLQTQQNGTAGGAWNNPQLQQQVLQQYQRMQSMQQNAAGATTPSNGALPNLSPSGSDAAGQTSATTSDGANNTSSDQLEMNQRSVDV
ncbi:Nuclear transcription factor Y subunit [Phytophthora megakarya]|uniref:Nuclear transcription factor Y subunit n=1 Tax=Phytophthora megakarya TaxID=4795 RepID=A0A225WY09_9STRA|nr:Nuclear transcription factor Y subunit [Phytophthora megakarya]